VLGNLLLKSNKITLSITSNIFIQITFALPKIIFITLHFFFINKVGRYG